MTLDGKVVVITGVGAGIGAATAEAFAEMGATVVGLELNQESLAQTVRGIQAKNGTVHPICTDVSSEESVAAAFRKIHSKFDRVDVLVNNAGIEFYKEFVDISFSDWDKQIAVNLRSVFLCCSQVVPAMIRAQAGCIINTASVQAFATTGQTAPYAAAKAGVLGLTRDMARDLGPFNIRVNAICPGCIHTPMMDRSLRRGHDTGAAAAKMTAAIPLKRLGRPQEIAKVAIFLASDLASYVSGIALLVDGGLMAQLPVT